MSFFFFNDTATTEIYTLSLHDALPIFRHPRHPADGEQAPLELPEADPVYGFLDGQRSRSSAHLSTPPGRARMTARRSEEHTSELQSRQYLVCRLLLEKKKQTTNRTSRL